MALSCILHWMDASLKLTTEKYITCSLSSLLGGGIVWRIAFTILYNVMSFCFLFHVCSNMVSIMIATCIQKEFIIRITPLTNISYR